MLKWKPLTSEQRKEMEEFSDWLKVAMDSTGFMPKSPSVLPKVEDLQEIVQENIQENLPIYEKLYERRLRTK